MSEDKRPFKAGDWVIGIPGRGTSERMQNVPLYVHRIREQRTFDGVSTVYVLDLSESKDTSLNACQGWYSYRFKLYRKDVVSKTFNGRKIG